MFVCVVRARVCVCVCVHECVRALVQYGMLVSIPVWVLLANKCGSLCTIG